MSHIAATELTAVARSHKQAASQALRRLDWARLEDDWTDRWVVNWIGQTATLLTALAAIAGGAFAIYKFFALKERESAAQERERVVRQGLEAIRHEFEQVIDMISADDLAHRRAAAILLRRFFDEDAEQGGRQTPYAKEALDVMSALLRGAEADAVQKLLADGLAYAPTLEDADLQETNLQQAYLGAQPRRSVDLSRADFFRADATGASFRGATLRAADFYQARLINTVFKEADLTSANFFEADLMGAKFDGAVLKDANFQLARNVPEDIASHLDRRGVYDGGDTESSPLAPTNPSVFFSRPGSIDIVTRRHLRALVDRIGERGFKVVELERDEYASTGAVAEVRRAMAGCAGVVVGCLADLVVIDGRWRAATPDAREISDLGLPSPWIFLELGVAFGLGLPVLLVLAEGVDLNAFDYGQAEPELRQVILENDHRSRTFIGSFDDWCGSVRETSRRLAVR